LTGNEEKGAEEEKSYTKYGKLLISIEQTLMTSYALFCQLLILFIRSAMALFSL